MAFNNTIIARAAASIWGLKLGQPTMQAALDQVQSSSVAATVNSAFVNSYGAISNAAIAAIVVNNLGLTGVAATNGTAYIVQQLAPVPASGTGAALLNIVNLFSTLGNDPVYGAAANAFNARVGAAVAYSSTAGTVDAVLGELSVPTGFNLGLGLDNVTGTAAADTFNAYVINNANTLQSADFIDGGAGTDTLFADMGSSAVFAVTPITRSVENILIRAQSRATGTADNNIADEERVNLDFERVSGVLRIESNNSRADVIVEDVRILPSQITRDITVAVVQSDPGNVDFGVYFDQPSLRADRTSSSSLILQVIDLRAAGAAATAATPLLDSPYDGVSFSINGTVVLLQDASFLAATTYAALLTAIQGAITRSTTPGVAGVITAALGAPFSVADSFGVLQTGTSIVLSAANATFGVGNWVASTGVPANTNTFTTQIAGGQNTVDDLVAVKVVLDDAGRGSNSGDLVIGNLANGETDPFARGIDRFEITVERNSRVQNIDSTNNWLKEVQIVNGTGSNLLTVLGNAGNGVIGTGNVPQGGTSQSAPLPGAVGQHDEFGFNDVRLIDASAFRGVLTFDATITPASFGKYITGMMRPDGTFAGPINDTNANPVTDNISVTTKTTQVADFIYTGGSNNDFMTVQIDGGIAGSRSTVLSSREDFTFSMNGGAGDDQMSLTVVNSTGMQGGLQAWYNNQQLNRNITIDGGDGNDTIRTPGAGDKSIIGGAGNDTVYSDNTGTLTQAIANAQASLLAAAYLADEAAELSNAQAIRTSADTTSATLAVRNSAALNTLVNAIAGTPGGVVTVVTDTAVTTATAAAVTAGVITAAQKTSIDTAANNPVNAADPTPAEITAALAIVNPLASAARTAAALAVAADTAAGVVPNAALTLLLNALTIGVTDVDVQNATAAALGGAFTVVQKAQIDAVAGLVAGAATVAEVEAMVRLVEAVTTNSTPQVNYLTLSADALVDATVVANNAAARVTALTALTNAIVLTTPDAAVVTALTNAVLVGAITAAESTAILAASAAVGAGVVDATELGAVGVVLAPILAAANSAQTAANSARATALDNNNSAVAVVINGSNVPGANTAENTAANAVRAAATTANDTAQLLVTNLNALKAALITGATDQAVLLATQAAVANGSILGPQKTAIDGLATATLNGVTPVTATEKIAIDAYIDFNLGTPAIAAAAITANTLANATTGSAQQAKFNSDVLFASASGFAGVSEAAPRAVFVVNTTNQQAVGAGYTLVGNDERNLADLRSDANNSMNFFGATLTVTFKGLTSTVAIPSTNFRTTDLQINQAIKLAINSDVLGVLNKLLLATDGPANSLVITSQIDGVMSNANLSFVVTLPSVVGVTDVAGAAAAYGLPASSTAADVLAAMTTVKAAFDSKGDYIDQLAESGAAGGNQQLSGANSTSTSDNTIAPGTGNDVIVLGTTTGLEAVLSSNEMVSFGAAFGNDTIVNFRAGSAASGGDVLNFFALGGTTLSTAVNLNRTITVAAEVAGTNGTAALIAALFTDSATAQTKVYVAFDSLTNIGKVYSVTDAVGTGVGSVTAVLAGTIDLADTLWSTLTVDNFGS